MNRVVLHKKINRKKKQKVTCARSPTLWGKHKHAYQSFTMGHYMIVVWCWVFFPKTNICTQMLAFWMEFFFWQFWRPSCGHGISLLCLKPVCFDKGTNSDLTAVSVNTNTIQDISATGFKWGKQSNFIKQTLTQALQSFYLYKNWKQDFLIFFFF